MEEADAGQAKGVEEADVLESALSAWGEAHLHREGMERFRGGPLALLTRARHETARRKVAHAIAMLEEATALHKYVVFAHHRDVQAQLREP